MGNSNKSTDRLPQEKEIGSKSIGFKGKIKVLNLYAGIGGNRKLWENVNVIAVEINPHIAAIYQELFSIDKVIVGDAHKYLIEHYKEFDFIWSSPPCQTHSKTNFFNHIEPRFPDMKLYEEIIFLQHFFKGKWVVENVKSYYKPLIKPQETKRHHFWANFKIPYVDINQKVRNDRGMTLDVKMSLKKMNVLNFHGFKGDKRTLINNCIEPKLGLIIMKAAANGKIGVMQYV